MPKSDDSVPIRRSSRVHVRIPATISGTYPDGRTFRHETHILNVSKFGASLETDLPLEVGMVVNVVPTFRLQAAVFRVVWAGRSGPSRTREFGIEYVEVCDLLGVNFPE